MAKISKDMLINDILAVDAGNAAILMAAGMHCIGCLAAAGETLEEAAAVHGLDAAELEAVTSATFTNNGLVAYGFRTKMSITFTADNQATYTSPNDKAFQGLFAVQQLFENPEQAIDNTFAPAQKAEKFIRNGQLYIRRGEHIFNALGQQL